MNKLFYYIFFPVLFIVMFISTIFCNYSFSFAEKSYYAKVEKDNVYLYKTTRIEDTLFILPKSYFVELLYKENDNFYYCKYLDINGYVKIEDVHPVVGTPVVPYANNLSFRVFTYGGANLRSSPTSSLGATNLIITTRYLDTNFILYNYTYGEEAIQKKGNIWYYCKYFNENTTYTGYIYSAFCDLESKIEINTEEVEYLSYEPFANIETGKQISELETMDSTLKTILIIVCCLPCFLIIYLLIKPTYVFNEKVENKQQNNKKIKRLKHSDYYEIDEDYFN